MPFADDLLKQAYQLAKKEGKNPKQASLRRAVSTGYYALFHLLVDDAVSNWMIEHQRSALARFFEHRTMKTVCDECVKEYFKAGSPPDRIQLVKVASTFSLLQQKRHAADYDIGFNWLRGDVADLLDQVRDAFKDWRAIHDQRPSQDFLIQLLMPKVFKLREGDPPPLKT
jgi:hypothetical protein